LELKHYLFLLVSLVHSADLQYYFLGLLIESLVFASCLDSGGKADLLQENQGNLKKHFLIADADSNFLQGLLFTLNVLDIIENQAAIIS